MADATMALEGGGPFVTADVSRAPSSAEASARLRSMMQQHVDFIWRSLRRLGVPQDAVEDATQQVFWTVARKIDDIVDGSEKSFLFGTAIRVASEFKRTIARRREDIDDALDLRESLSPPADELVDRTRARAYLAEILAAMPMDRRAVFVLFELEGFTCPEIATTLELPLGTVASRLRRAREEFESALSTLEQRARGRAGSHE